MAMSKQDAEEYTQSLSQIFAGSWRQIAWAHRQGIPQALGLTTEQWVKDRLGGYIRLAIAERREAVATLTTEGHSTRQVGEILGVDHKTVVRDLSGANAPKLPSKRAQTGANAPTTAEIMEQIKQVKEEARAEIAEEMRVAYETEKKTHEQELMQQDKELEQLREQLRKAQGLQNKVDRLELESKNLKEEIKRGPPLSDFATEIDRITGPLVRFIQHDDLIKMLSELELEKENIKSDVEMYHLDRVISSLESLAQRADFWAKRLTPRNERWSYRNRRVDKTVELDYDRQ